ncbi:MAG: histidinol dehydrogenase [Thermoplasmatota archaeon]
MMATLPAIERLADADTKRLLQRAQGVPAVVHERVATIVAQVRADGDAALRRLTAELDGCELTDPWLSEAEWDDLAAQVPRDVQAAIDGNLARIQAFHARQVRREDTFEVAPGVLLGRRPIPLDAVGCYVPGGRASYPSTVLMTVTPATLAGVRRIVVVTPPRPDGSIDPAVAYAARAAGAHAVLRAGGAQAVAALAYGTDQVPAVDGLVGPGNAYVTAAKALVADRLRLDAPAGPSELLVIADATADATAVALDLLAQAEHDPDAQVVLVALGDDVAEAVRQEVERLLPDAPRRDIMASSLRDHGAFLVADDLEEALAFSNAYAPEHLELVVADPRLALEGVTSAGSVFLGAWAPVSLGDYGSGTNHVLPTMGHARLRGGLLVDDFVKWMTWQEVTLDGLEAVADDVAGLADAEGLHGHAAAVRERLGRREVA